MKTDWAVHSNMRTYLFSNWLAMWKKTQKVLDCMKFIDNQDLSQDELYEVVTELDLLITD